MKTFKEKMCTLQKKIWIVLLACLCLSFVTSDIEVKAEEPEKCYYINPVYANVISEDDLRKNSEEFEITNPPKLAEARFSYCDDMYSVVSQLRTKMVARKESVHLRYTQKGFVEDAWFDELLEQTFEETERPYEGDYLRWNCLGCEIEYEVFAYDAYPSANTQNYYDIMLEFTYTTTYDQESKFQADAGRKLTELGIDEMTSDYDKIKTIYDYICENVTYDFKNLEDDKYLLKYSAYAAFENKTAVCQGYANLFYYMTKKAKVKTKIIGGESFDVGHAWNIVKLEDLYYNADATWDAGMDSYEYFLKGSNTFDLDHERDSEYLTEKFLQKYPVSEEDYKGASIKASGKCGENITWQLDAEGTMWITGSGDMYTWKSDTEVPWYDYKNEIETIKFSGEITSIGRAAFLDCSKLTTEIILPETLRTIESSAFGWCKQLKGDLILPDSVISVGAGAFNQCWKLERVQLSAGLKEIGKLAFANGNFECDGKLPETLEVIGDEAFMHTYNMKGDLILPESLESIGEEAFRFCSGLTGDLIIPEKITHISDYTFSECTGLNGKLVIPETVTSIGQYAFNGCSGLKGALEMPSKLTKIESGTFSGCRGLTGNLVIPETVTSIGFQAFSGCSGLTGGLVIPKTISVIESRTFLGCSGFTGNLVIPENITSIGSYAFENCKGLTGDVVLPDSVLSLGYNVFSGCSGLDGTLKLSSSMEELGDYALYNSYFSGELILEENIKRIERESLNNTKNLDSVIIKNKDCVIDDSTKAISKEIIIISHPDSPAHEYAKKYNRVFRCLEHRWDDKVTVDTEPTCEKEGKQGIHCLACDYMREDSIEIIPVTGHDYKWIIDKHATPTAEGKKHQVCGWCEKITNENTVIKRPEAALDAEKYAHTGENIEPVVIITDSEGKVFERGIDYVISGNLKETDTGRYTVKVSYIGEYTGTKTLNYAIVPAKVEDFKAELSGGHDDIKLTWEASEGATRYYVSYKKSSETKYSSQKWTSKTNYSIKDLSDGVSYDFRVVPFYVDDDVKYYADSEYAYTSLKTSKNVKAPSKVSVSPYIEYDDVKVTWSKSTGAAGYKVYYKMGTSDEYVYLTSTTQRNTKDAVDLKDGVKYTFKVVPYYKDGDEIRESYYSNTKTIYILKKLDTPKVTRSSSKVKVQWNNISGESGYQISRSSKEDGTYIVTSYSTTSGKTKTVSATKGKTYYYRVRAYKTVDGKKIPGPWSDPVKYVR